MRKDGKGGAVEKLRRSWSAGRERSANQANRSVIDPASVRSGPGVIRSFGESSRFQGNDLSYDLSDFSTTDFSMQNQNRHNWRKEDTFLTPAGHVGGKAKQTPHTAIDIEDSHVIGTCSFQKEWLIAMKNKIVEGMVAEIQSETALVRQDIANITSDVQSAVIENLSAELRVLRVDLAEQAHVQLESYRQDLASLHQELRANMSSTRDSVDVGVRTSQADVDFTAMINELRSLQNAILGQVGTDVEHIMDQLNDSRRSQSKDTNYITEQINAIQASVLREIEAIAAHSKANKETVVVGNTPANSPQCDIQVDFEPVRNQIDASKAEVLDAIRAINVEVEKSVMRSVESSGALPVDFEAQLQNIDVSKSDVDLTLICSQINAMQTRILEKLGTDVEHVLQQITTSGGQYAEVLNQILTVLKTIHTSIVQEPKPTMEASQVNVDLGPVLEAISRIDTKPTVEASQVKVDLGPVLEAISGISSTPVVEASQVNVDLRPVLEAISRIDVKLNGPASAPSIDLSPVLEAIAGIDSKVDFTQILEEIQKNRRIEVPVSAPSVDLDPVLEAISRSLAELKVDFTQEICNIKAIETPVSDQAVDSSPPVSVPSVDLSPILDAISGIDLKVDFTQILEEIRSIKVAEAPISDPPVGSSPPVPAPPADLSPVLAAISGIDLKVDFTEILEEIRKSQTADGNVDLNPVLQMIETSISTLGNKVDFAQVLAEMQTMQTNILERVEKGLQPQSSSPQVNLQVDLGDILKEMQLLNKAMDDRKWEVDFEPIVNHMNAMQVSIVEKVIQGSVVDLEPVLEAVCKVDLQVDFTEVLNEIQCLKKTVDNIHVGPSGIDLESVVNQISITEARIVDQIQQSSDPSRADLCEAFSKVMLITEGRIVDQLLQSSDPTRVLEAISKVDSRVGFAVDQVIQGLKVDLQAVLEATSKVDLTEVTKEISLVRKAVDELHKEAHEANKTIDMRVDLIKKIVDGIHLDVDFEPVMKQINAMQISIANQVVQSSVVDFKPVLEALDAGFTSIKQVVDATQLHGDDRHLEFLNQLKAMQISTVDQIIRGSVVDLKPVLDAISQIDLQVDFGPVTNQMNTMRMSIVDQVVQRSTVDLEPVLEAISKIDLRVDFTEVINETQLIKQVVDGIHLDVDFGPVMSQMNSMQVNIVDQVMQGCIVDLQPVLEAISKIDLKIDVVEAQLNNEIQVVKKVVDSMNLDVDLAPVINQVKAMQISIVDQVVQRSAVDFQPVLEAISNIDFSKRLTDVLSEVHLVKRVVDGIHLAVDAISLDVDFGPVISHMNAMQLTIIDQVIKGSEVDLKPVLEAISKIDLDYSPILQSIDSLRTNDVMHIVQRIDALKWDSDFFAPVLNQMNAMQVSIATQIRSVDYGPVLEAISKIDLHYDIDEILNAIGTKSSKATLVDFGPIVQRIDVLEANLLKVQANVDLRPIVQRIDVLEANLQGNLGVLMKMEGFINYVHAKLEAIEGKESLKVNLDFGPVLHRIDVLQATLQQGEGSLDFGPILHRIDVLEATLQQGVSQDVIVQLDAKLDAKLGVVMKMESFISYVHAKLEDIDSKMSLKVDHDFGPILQRIDVLGANLQQGVSQDVVVQLDAKLDTKLGVVMKMESFISYVYAKLEDIDGNNEQFLIRLSRLNELNDELFASFKSLGTEVHSKVKKAVAAAVVGDDIVSAMQDVFGKDIASTLHILSSKIREVDMHITSVEKEMTKITNNSIAGRTLDSIEGKMGFKATASISSEIQQRLVVACGQGFDAETFLREVLWCCQEEPPELLLSRFDQDQNAVLEPSEFKQMLEHYGNVVSLTEDQVKEVFNLIDTNRDGVISIQELRASFGILKRMSLK